MVRQKDGVDFNVYAEYTEGMSNEAFTALLGRYYRAKEDALANPGDLGKIELVGKLFTALGEIPRAKGHSKICLCQTCDNIRSRPPTTEKRENYCIKVPGSLRADLRGLGPTVVEAALSRLVDESKEESK